VTFIYGLATHELDDVECAACLTTPLLSWKNSWRSPVLNIIAAKDVSFKISGATVEELLVFGGTGGLHNDM